MSNGGTFTIADQYDPQGHVAQRIYPDGLVTPFSPNAWGEPSQVGSFASGISYWPSGNAAAYTYGNSLTYNQTLDARLRPNVILATGGSAGNVVYLQYAYDNDNNVTTITDNGAGSQSRGLGYDGLDRLTTASGVWGSAVYGYDPLDNLRTETIGGQTINTVYNTGTNRIDGVSDSISRSYSYDRQGNLSSNGVNTFVFDVANRLAQTAGVANYRYDGHGRRTIAVKTGTTEYSVYDVAGNLVYTLDTKSCATTDYLNLENKPLAQTSAGVTTYLHTDELGSPIAATNASGAWLWYEEYQPYGLKLNGVSEKIGFTGHVYDADTGLTDMQARLYDPLIGRFLSTDPKAFNASSPFTFNRYAYANNNPYRYTDPNGAVAQAVVAGAALVAVAIAYEATQVCTAGSACERNASGFLDRVGETIRETLGGIFSSPDKPSDKPANNPDEGATDKGPTINPDKQGKHQPGHPNFQPGKSELTHPDPQGLVDRGAGTGDQVGDTPVGEAGSKERVDFGEPIGNHVDPETGAKNETPRGIIHYGKDDVHIVPARPKTTP